MIKAIISDLGRVILDFDHKISISKLVNLINIPAEELNIFNVMFFSCQSVALHENVSFFEIMLLSAGAVNVAFGAVSSRLNTAA